MPVKPSSISDSRPVSLIRTPSPTSVPRDASSKRHVDAGTAADTRHKSLALRMVVLGLAGDDECAPRGPGSVSLDAHLQCCRSYSVAFDFHDMFDRSIHRRRAATLCPPGEFQAPCKARASVSRTPNPAIPPSRDVSAIQTGENERNETLGFVTQHPALQAPFNLGVETQTPRACQ